ASTSTVSLNPLVNTTYTVYGVSGTCSNNAVVTVTVNTTPTITISGTSTLCAGSSVSFSANGANTYSWSTSAITSTILVNPLVNTSYSVVGTTTDGCNNSAIVSTTVFVLPTITVNSGSVCAGQVFTMVPSGASTYTYSNGTSTVIPVTNSSYTITGTSVDGCLGTSAISSVTINATPTVAVNSGSICAGQSFVIVPSGAASYVISGGSATVNPLVNTSYSVTGSSSLGCNSANTAICNITVVASPNLSITASSFSVCAGNTTTLNVSGANSYTWNNNLSATSITVAPTSPTNYSVVGVNAAGCAGTSNLSIGIFPTPTVLIGSTSNSVCSGFSAMLTASGAVTYSWSSGSTGSFTSVSPLSTTVYSVSGIDLNGCVGASSITIFLNPMPTVAIVPESAGVCYGYTTALVANGAATYSWNTGATTTSIVVSPSVNTAYTVTGSSGAGCVSTQIVTITAYPSPSIYIGTDVEVSLGSNLQFTPSQTACVTYSWNPPDYLNSTSVINPVTTPLNDITYTLTGLSANGCLATDTVNVKVLTKLKIANYMSPNGDGKNDVWKVNSPSLIKDYSILIIDSYNQTVYTKDNNYNNEFDGKRNGELLPDGVYYYFIKEGTTVKYKGSITLTK
ncbi:MAG: gliding motility-associated C-terminal domain-containing protein, partial [Bacteroidia bacterium]|nr:gliding motility-associated C-terminal domain-containing protein [Bacteroidia bacterium]